MFSNNAQGFLIDIYSNYNAIKYVSMYNTSNYICPLTLIFPDYKLM